MHVYAAGPRPPDMNLPGPRNNSCTPQTFADTLLVQPGVNAPVTLANEYAIEKWELRERWRGRVSRPSTEPAFVAIFAWPSGNPLNTTQPDAGSGPAWNSVGVQSYQDAAGHTCWYWVCWLRPKPSLARSEVTARSSQPCSSRHRTTSLNASVWPTPSGTAFGAPPTSPPAVRAQTTWKVRSRTTSNWLHA